MASFIKSLMTAALMITSTSYAAWSSDQMPDDLNCSSPAVIKIVRTLARKDFMKTVGAPNKLYDSVKAVRTQTPGICIANYEYTFGPPSGYHGPRSRGDFLDWFGGVDEIIYDFQVTDDKQQVIVHVSGFQWTSARYGLPRPEEQR